MDKNNRNIFENLAKKYLRCDMTGIEEIGAGFYGRVYRLSLEGKLSSAVVKVHTLPGDALREESKLALLKKHEGSMKIPRVYARFSPSPLIPFEGLIMEDIPGVQAVEAHFDKESERDAFAREIIDNLLGYHQVRSHGFGPWNNPDQENWENYFYSLIINWRKELEKGDRDSRLSPPLMKDIDDIIENYHDIFADSVFEPVLIHGDFNLWNILVDPETFKPLGVIDPGDSCFGDRELELFQLQNAGGDRFHLLDIYRETVPLSKNFETKNSFYWLWDDIKHYIRTGRIIEERAVRLARDIKERLDDRG